MSPSTSDHVPADRAFLILTRFSQETNAKVYDVAARLVRTRVTPDRSE